MARTRRQELSSSLSELLRFDVIRAQWRRLPRRVRQRRPAHHGDRARVSLPVLPRLAAQHPAVRGVSERRHRGDDDDLHHDGDRAEHRRRVRGPPRPRLRRLLRGGRLYRCLVRLAAFRRVGDVARRRSRREPERGRLPCLDLDRRFRCRDSYRLYRCAHRPADVASPRRLPCDRHARVRRDHAPDRPERRQPLRHRLQPHERRPGDQPGRSAGVRRALGQLARAPSPTT